MKAVVFTRYGSPDVLNLADIPTPTPRDTELLVRIHTTTVSPVDCSFRAGDPFITRFYLGLRRPKKTVLGTALAGEVVALGKDVSQFQPGDQIFAAPADGTGAHAQYICLPAAGALAKTPPGMPPEQAVSLCDGALTALPFLRDSARIRRGQRVLIVGASGAIGTSAVQLAKHFGAHVTGVCSGANLDLVRGLGADRVIDYTVDDFTRQGETWDIIFDTVAKSTFARSRRSLTPNGVYLVTAPSFATVCHMLRSKIFGGRRPVISATGLRPAAQQRKDLEFLKSLIGARVLKMVIDRSFPLERIAAAHAYVAKGHKRGNVIVTL